MLEILILHQHLWTFGRGKQVFGRVNLHGICFNEMRTRDCVLYSFLVEHGIFLSRPHNIDFLRLLHRFDWILRSLNKFSLFMVEILA